MGGIQLQLIVVIFIFFVFIISPWWCTTLTFIKVADDWGDNFFNFLLLLLVLFGISFLVFIQPVNTLFDGLVDGFGIFLREFTSELFFVSDLVLETIKVSFKFVTSFNTLLQFLVFVSEFLGILDHTLDILRSETVLVVANGDGFLATGSFIFGSDTQHTVDINFEGNFNLWNTSWCWGDVLEVEFSKKVVILGHWTFTFKDLDGDSWLVIGGCREDLALLGWDNAVTWDKFGHDTTNSFNTKSQRVDIKKEDFGIFLSAKNTTLDSCTVGNSFVRVDTTGRFFTVEVFLDKLLDLRDTSGSSDKHNFVNFVLLEITISKDFLHWLEGGSEQVHVQFFKTGSGKSLREVFTFEEGFNFNSGLVLSRKCSLCLFDFTTKFLESPVVTLDVLSLLLLVEFDKVFHNTLVEIFTSKMGISVG
eukprot:m.17128 g.17128  ORF g.17128 m.17128 type:complete len:419 (+) comp5909_c0_seq1:167-1423(+)